MHLTREESHQDHRHKGQIGIQRHKLNGKKRKWWWGVEERSKGKGEMVEWEGSKAQTKVLMCCSQSQRVLALPGSLASGAYWCGTTSRFILGFFPGLRDIGDHRSYSITYIWLHCSATIHFHSLSLVDRVRRGCRARHHFWAASASPPTPRGNPPTDCNRDPLFGTDWDSPTPRP